VIAVSKVGTEAGEVAAVELLLVVITTVAVVMKGQLKSYSVLSVQKNGEEQQQRQWAFSRAEDEKLSPGC
jgi:hypothetical protein